MFHKYFCSTVNFVSIKRMSPTLSKVIAEKETIGYVRTKPLYSNRHNCMPV